MKTSQRKMKTIRQGGLAFAILSLMLCGASVSANGESEISFASGAWFEIKNEAEVTLDAQDGTGGSASVTATYGKAMPEATMPTKTGYAFNGYFDAQEGGVKYYNADGTSAANWDKTANTTLYAQWTAKDYAVTFELDGGSGVTSTSVVFGQIPAKIAVPTKAGAKFVGFFTETGGKGTRVFDEYGIATEPWATDADTMLYASWIRELWKSAPAAATFDLRAVKPAQVFKPEMLTSSPKGWEADAKTAAIFEAIGEGSPVVVVDPVTAPVTVWTPQNVGLFTLTHTAGDGEETAQFNVTGFIYTVAFDANGGTGEAMAGVDLAYGAEGTAPACAYERTDYEFDSWNTRKDGTGLGIAVGGKFSNLVAAASEIGHLYAQWSLKTAYEFHVDVKEGEPEPILEEIKLPTAWLEENLPPEVDKTKPEEVKAELEKKDETGLKNWHKYVLGVGKNEKDAKIWIDSPQQKAADKIKVKMREFSPTKGTGFAVKYRLDTELKGKEKAKGDLAASPDFDIDVSQGDPTGLYTINVVFVPEGKEDSDEVVASMNTVGILKVPSPKTLEIVAVPWEELAPSNGAPITVANLVKKATLTDGDKLHVYDRGSKDYKSYLYHAAEQTWEALGVYKVTAAGLEKTGGAKESAEQVARGSAVWLERQDASKPFFLYGQYNANAVETKIAAREHNLVASPTFAAFKLNDGKITGAIGASDQIIVPQGGNAPPKVYTYKTGKGWGYSKTEVKNGIVRATFCTTDDEVPAGTGFWYISKGGAPTIKW